MLIGLAAAAALAIGLMQWADRAFPAASGLFIATTAFAIFAISPSVKHALWWLAVITTTLSVGLFWALFWGFGVGSSMDDVLTTETRSFLFMWPLTLLVSTFVGGLVGTRSFRNALAASTSAVLLGGLAWGVTTLVGVEGGPAGVIFGVVGLVVYSVRTWTKRPESLRTNPG